MFGLTILDLLLVVALLSYLIHGLRNGFLVTLGGIAGFAAGAVAAFVSVPIVSGLVEDSGWRLTAIVATAVLLMIVGNGLGTMIGRRIRSVVVTALTLRCISSVGMDFATPSMSWIPAFARSMSVTVDTDIGTSCSGVARFCA